ncbi:hypothetical protein [Paludibacterium purpuratum]|uniref:hypothetical protein n=1 Tax=Paludibacterium purpuratum TaxID=1144873 RepID=UPI00105E4303|nr:hypothetical protein [Paludibacterium purpuratum]
MPALAAGLACAAALADDEMALQLADQAAQVSEKPRDVSVLLESALLVGAGQPGMQRQSVDVRWNGRLGQDWQGVLADRVDSRFFDAPARNQTVNTLKEAYVSRTIDERRILDLGRINTRYGVGYGYNPTDFLGQGTVRSVVSADQESWRQNRLGNVMLRWQNLWDSGSLTAIWSPRLAGQPDNRGSSPDWGASNPRDRLLLVLSQHLTPTLYPQWMLLNEQDGSPQLGFNLSWGFDNATVLYLEWAGGRQQRMVDRALAADTPSVWHNRSTVGINWSSAGKLNWIVEWQFDGAAPDRQDWQAVQANPAQYGAYRAAMANSSDLLTRRSAMVRAAWQDAMIDKLDLVAIYNLDLIDHSASHWLEARYHLGACDLALQWQQNRGGALSHYGAGNTAAIWQLVFDYFY